MMITITMIIMMALTMAMITMMMPHGLVTGSDL